jgi:hypothetical protein
MGCGVDDALLPAEKSEPSANSKADADDPQAQLQKDVAEAISLLEKGEVAKFLDWYLPLKDLESIRKQTTVEEAAKEVKAQGYDKKLLERLREMKKSEVEFLDNDKSKARLVANAKTEESDESSFSLPDPAEEKIPQYDGFPGELKEAIAAAIKALEAGEHKKFVENMFPESELSLIKSDEGMKAVLDCLKEHPQMAEQMAADFKSLQTLTPKYNAEKTTATLELHPGTKQARTILFEKAGTWRMANSAKQIRAEVYKQSRQKPVGIQIQATPTPQWIRIRDHWRLAKLPDLNG